MKGLIKGILVIFLIAAFACTFFVTLYCSISLSQQISRSNTLMYTKLSDLERLSEGGVIPDISIRKAIYEGGDEVILWDFADFVNIIREKRVTDIFIQESQYVFPFTVVSAKVWVVVGQTKYVFNFL